MELSTTDCSGSVSPERESDAEALLRRPTGVWNELFRLLTEQVQPERLATKLGHQADEQLVDETAD